MSTKTYQVLEVTTEKPITIGVEWLALAWHYDVTVEPRRWSVLVYRIQDPE